MSNYETNKDDDTTTDTLKNRTLFIKATFRSFIGLGLIVLQQMCGVNSLIFNIDDVFNSFNIENTKIQLIMVGVFVCQVSKKIAL